MAANFDIVKNKKGKSFIWKYFGFVKEYDSEVDNKRVACRLCHSILKYSGNTTNLMDHVRRKHSDVSISNSDGPLEEKKVPSKHSSFSFFTKKALPPNSDRAKEISSAILGFIIKDLRPFSVVENEGFKNLIHVLEARYKIPSRHFFSDRSLGELYNRVKEKVKASLSAAEAVALTTDGWTSRATESYVTITCSHIDEEWKLNSYILQTRALPDSHTGVNIAHVLSEAVKEWGLPPSPPLVTDNASNMIVAADEYGSIHIGCLAHTLNLACGKALHITSVANLLAKMRRIVSYFHRSCLATTALKEKQTLLQLPVHKLIKDVSTRWNSALDMVSRYLEQQPAIYAALTSKELRGKEKDLATLSDRDIACAEDLVTVLTPLKVATTALCEEKIPTISMILPLQHQLLNVIMKEKEKDSALIKQVKKSVADDFSGRYQDESTRKCLKAATLLDPRFKTAPFLSDEEKLNVYHDITLECVKTAKDKGQAVKVKVEPSTDDEQETEPPLPYLSDSEPSPKKAKKDSDNNKGDSENTRAKDKPTAMSALFGDVYITHVKQPKPLQESCEAEISQYRKETPINANENPLNWWKEHSHRFPNLSVVVKRYLCTPATSVPSERVFSTAGDIVTAKRAQLKSEYVDKLIFLKKNWNISS